MPPRTIGNYGWRVYEGFACTGTDRFLCNPDNFIMPRFDYSHTNSRCSITGGYVYRGSQGAFVDGTYLFGDFCTGEIFSWDGANQSLVLDTNFSISSFGEDEAGEVYVANLSGSVSRLFNTTPICSVTIAPTSRNFVAAGGAGTVSVTAGASCSWTAQSNDPWLRVTSGASGSGNGTVGFFVDPNAAAASRSGTLTIGGRTFAVAQNGNVACTFTISPAQAVYAREGGTGTVAVSADFGCDWDARSHSSWITISGERTGSGNGTLSYVVAPRTGRLGTRGGKLTIAGQAFTIRQTR